MTTLNETHLFTAACLWEAALESCNTRKPNHFDAQLLDYRRRHGTCEFRDQIARLAIRCDQAWNAMSEDEQDKAGCFDWEFVPHWLEANFFRIVHHGA